MLDEYFTAFVRYLHTGTVGALSDFCGEHADLARLRVYRNGFIKACIEALRANYPSVERLAGEERFPVLARPYVEAHPPHAAASLVEYGEDFPRFIEDAREMHRLDCLASFAALDRAWSEVHFAEDADPGATDARPGAAETVLTGDSAGDFGACGDPGRRLAPGGTPTPESDGPGTPGPAGGLPGDAEALMALRGRLAPRVRLVSLDHTVLHTWSLLRQGEPGRRAEVRRTPQHVLIWRSGAEILHRVLERPEHVFIARIAAGKSCGEAAGAALDADAGFDLAAAFASLLHHRILAFEQRIPAG